MKKCEFSKLTNMEVVDQQKKVLVLPIGTVESNGPHQLLGTDYLLAEDVASEICRRSDYALRLPSIAYGVSFSQEGSPGTLSISSELLTEMIGAIVEAGVRNGFRKYLLVNCHRGNNGAIEDNARRFRRDGAAVIAQVDPVALGKAGPFSDAPAETLGHGGDPALSMMMHLYGADIRLDLSPTPEVSNIAGVRPLSSQYIAFRGARAGFFLTSCEVNSSGSWADTSRSSAEKGKETFEWVVEYTAEYLEWLCLTPLADLNPQSRP